MKTLINAHEFKHIKEIESSEYSITQAIAQTNLQASNLMKVVMT